MKKAAVITLMGSIVLMAAIAAFAEMPRLINYQGILLDGDGAPITTGESVEFRIWDDSMAGNQLWSETRTVTPNANGLFDVLLGEVNPIPDSAFATTETYLSVTIPPDLEMAPRARLVAVAYAFRPGTIDGATGGTVTGNLGVNTNNPLTTLHIKGTVDDPDGTLMIEAFESGSGNRDPRIQFRDADGDTLASIAHHVTGSGKPMNLVLENRQPGDIKLWTGGAERLTVTDAGTVGINTDSPLASLHIKGTALERDGRLILEGYEAGGADRDPAIIFKDGDGTELSSIAQHAYGFAKPVNLLLMNLQPGDVQFWTNSIERMTITEAGDVGIGTGSPQGALDVSSTTGAFIVPRMTTLERDALTAVNGMIVYNTTTNAFNFRENSAWVTK